MRERRAPASRPPARAAARRLVRAAGNLRSRRTQGETDQGSVTGTFEGPAAKPELALAAAALVRTLERSPARDRLGRLTILGGGGAAQLECARLITAWGVAAVAGRTAGGHHFPTTRRTTAIRDPHARDG